MTERLLNRQIKLLEYLTSGDAIFGGGRTGGLDPTLRGIDRGLLDLEARFSHEKRMEKIAGVFPATLALLGADREAVVREFADACPPHDISRIDNARQFRDFLVARRKRQAGGPRHLPDVAACELACAQARLQADAEPPVEAEQPAAPRPAARRSRGVVLLQTAFDIRAIFEDDAVHGPVERDTYVAVAWISEGPHILELTPEVYAVLEALDRWVPLEDLLLEDLPDADELVDELANAGLLELRR
jgi:hypothetical protein